MQRRAPFRHGEKAQRTLAKAPTWGGRPLHTESVLSTPGSRWTEAPGGCGLTPEPGHRCRSGCCGLSCFIGQRAGLQPREVCARPPCAHLQAACDTARSVWRGGVPWGLERPRRWARVVWMGQMDDQRAAGSLKRRGKRAHRAQWLRGSAGDSRLPLVHFLPGPRRGPVHAASVFCLTATAMPPHRGTEEEVPRSPAVAPWRVTRLAPSVPLAA